jgi:single-stranded DNA-binding protein
MNTMPHDILLAQYLVRHVVFVNGRRYVVSWQSKDGVNKYYLDIVGEREGIDPRTKYDASPTVRYFNTSVSPYGKLGKKIMAAVEAK